MDAGNLTVIHFHSTYTPSSVAATVSPFFPGLHHQFTP